MNTSDIIRAFITHEMLHESLATPLGDDDQLVESGIIDSLGVMTLSRFLEVATATCSAIDRKI
jgi:aryl carrier-like protein